MSYNINQTMIATGGAYSFVANEVDLARAQVPAAGTITTITYYADSTSMVGMPVIYSTSGTFGTPQSLLWYGSEVTVTANGSLTVTANHAFGAAQELWIGFHGKQTGLTKGLGRVDKNAAGTTMNPGRFHSATYGTPPAGPFTGTTYNRAMAMRVMFQPTTDTDRTLVGLVDLTQGSVNSWAALADELTVMKVTLATAALANKVRLWSQMFALNASVKPVIYADSAGEPGALVAAGSAVVGMYPGANDLPFSGDVSLAAGSYWYGFVSDVGWTAETATTLTAPTRYKTVAGQYATPPSTAPGSMTAGVTLGAPAALSYSIAASSRRRPGVAICG